MNTEMMMIAGISVRFGRTTNGISRIAIARNRMQMKNSGGNSASPALIATY